MPKALFGPRTDTAGTAPAGPGTSTTAAGTTTAGTLFDSSRDSTATAGALRTPPAALRATGNGLPAPPGTVGFHPVPPDPALPEDGASTTVRDEPVPVTGFGPSVIQPPSLVNAAVHPADAVYVHNYHEEIVAADAADYARRSTNDPVSSPRLGPRMWRHLTLTSNISDLDRKSFLSTALHVLNATDAPVIQAWYTQLVLQATIANIDLCPLREFNAQQALWPSNKPANLVFEMSSLLLAKITPLLDLRHSAIRLLFESEVTHSDSKLAGYRVLHSLLTLADMVFQQTIPTLPLFTGSHDVVQFATELYQFQQDNARQLRVYNDRQLSVYYLQTLTAFDYPLHVQYTQLMDLPADAALPHSLHFRTIALIMARRDATSGSHLGPATRPAALPFLPTAHRLLPSTARSPRTGNGPASRHSSAGDSAAVPISAPFRLREELQCTACGTWGHSMQRCSQLAKHTLLTQFSATHASDARRAASAWQQLHSANPRPSAVSRRLVHDPPADSLTLFDVIYDADVSSPDLDPLHTSVGADVSPFLDDAAGASSASDFRFPG